MSSATDPVGGPDAPVQHRRACHSRARLPVSDGLFVQAIRVDYEPGGFAGATHRHPAGAYVYVIDGSVEFVVGDGEPIVLNAGESFCEPPGALHSVSRNVSGDVTASLIAFFVLRDGESATVYDRV